MDILHHFAAWNSWSLTKETSATCIESPMPQDLHTGEHPWCNGCWCNVVLHLSMTQRASMLQSNDISDIWYWQISLNHSTILTWYDLVTCSNGTWGFDLLLLVLLHAITNEKNLEKTDEVWTKSSAILRSQLCSTKNIITTTHRCQLAASDGHYPDNQALNDIGFILLVRAAGCGSNMFTCGIGPNFVLRSSFFMTLLSSPAWHPREPRWGSERFAIGLLSNHRPPGDTDGSWWSWSIIFNCWMFDVSKSWIEPRNCATSPSVPGFQELDLLFRSLDSNSLSSPIREPWRSAQPPT